MINATNFRYDATLFCLEVTATIKAVVDGMTEDPGHSDLDNEQPIVVRMTLGDYRRAKRLLWELEHP